MWLFLTFKELETTQTQRKLKKNSSEAIFISYVTWRNEKKDKKTTTSWENATQSGIKVGIVI